MPHILIDVCVITNLNRQFLQPESMDANSTVFVQNGLSPLVAKMFKVGLTFFNQCNNAMKGYCNEHL